MPKVTRHLSNTNRKHTTPRSPLTGLVLAAICFAMALGLTVRVSALPAEARTQETWYSYRSELQYDFTAAVVAGSVYPSAVMRAEELYRLRVPVEPAVYKRTILTKLANSVTLRLPFSFVGDRPGDIKVVYRVDGVLAAPGFWQKPYPLVQRNELTVSGTEASTVLEITIPLRQMAAELDKLAKEVEIRFEPVELRVRPVIEVEVTGAKEPVKLMLNPEILVSLAGNAIELDEPKLFSDAKVFNTTKVVPLTMQVLGWQIPVVAARQIALTALTIFTVLLGAMMAIQWLRRKVQVGEDLKRLGAGLISARSFELPDGATVVDVSTPSQLVALHLQMDRPVIKVGNTYYMTDGSTCYRLSLATTQD